ncbi:MAG TPA: hypothetical protein VGN54_04315, partial [Mycobacteriales bacterium]|nr:hypothetical protein [Mycobacteriales bacterium]
MSLQGNGRARRPRCSAAACLFVVFVKRGAVGEQSGAPEAAGGGGLGRQAGRGGSGRAAAGLKRAGA